MMKALLCFVFLLTVTVLSAQENEWDVLEFDGIEDTKPEVFENPGKEPDIYDEDSEDDYDDENEENNDNDEEDPTTAYPKRRRWPGYKCMIKAKKCFMNATDCEEHLACYEEKSRCMQAAKKEQQIPSMKKTKTMCKTAFSKCMEGAGNDCFKKFMCYRKKGFCYRSRGRGYRRSHCRHHFRSRHHRGSHRHPTMSPEMWKCKMGWKMCFMQANNCSQRLQCMYDFHDCMNRSRPTGPPSTMSPKNEDMDVYRRRWNPKLVAKCRREFQECIENASTICPLKMRCFWRMKMCFMSHRRPHYHVKMIMKNRGMGERFGGTGIHWGNRGMATGIGRQWRKRGMATGIGRQWGKRGMATGIGRQWENRGMATGSGRQWGNRGMATGSGRQWGNRGMATGSGRQWGNRGNRFIGKFKKVFKPMQKRFKNLGQLLG